MAMQKGERYRCTDEACGCEIEVTRGASEGKSGNLLPRCCCGMAMERVTRRVVLRNEVAHGARR
jgi:hypothetical protein